MPPRAPARREWCRVRLPAAGEDSPADSWEPGSPPRRARTRRPKRRPLPWWADRSQRARRMEAAKTAERLRACALPAGTLRRMRASRDTVSLAAQRVHRGRSEEHTSALQSQFQLVCRLLLEKKKLILTKMSPSKKTKTRYNR